VSSPVAPLLPARSGQPHQPHPLHGPEQVWGETNCYVDLWVEVLHSLGLDPVPAGVTALSADFDGDQWTFLKPPPEDLWALYGVEVSELNVWRPLADHLADHLARGRLLTVEVDSFWLPDTAGVSYRRQHTKTTIAVAGLDRGSATLDYFHGAGRHTLSGEDLDGVLRLVPGADRLPPYVEVVRVERIFRDERRTAAAATRLAREHLARRRDPDPLSRLGERLVADLPWLAAQDMDTFHGYAFATCRQCGATAQLAAQVCAWLEARTGAQLARAATCFAEVAADAKSLQFLLARGARGRTVDLAGPLGRMATAWTTAMREVAGGLGG